MKFPEVAKGLRLVLFGELVELISIVAFSILQVIAPSMSTLWTVLTLVFAIGNAILCLAGLAKAGKGEKQFYFAWQIVIGLLIANVLLSLFSLIVKDINTSFSDLCITVFDVLATICVLRGITSIYEQKGLTQYTGFVNTTSILFHIRLLFEIVFAFCSSLIAENTTFMVIIFIVYIIVELLAYIFYLICLGKGSKRAIE